MNIMCTYDIYIYISNFVAVNCWCFFVIVDGKPDLTISAPRFPHKHFVWWRETKFPW